MRFSMLSLAALVPIAISGCKGVPSYDAFQGEPAPESDHGQYLSMETAPDGRLSIAFYDRELGALGFALGQGGAHDIAWKFEEVDGYPDSGGLDSGDVGQHTSHAWAPDGSAWVAYHGPGQGNLKVAHRVGTEWTTEVVDSGAGLKPKTGLFTDIAIDANGDPVIVYHDEGEGTLNIARRTGGTWTTLVLETGLPFSGVDENGEPIERPADVGEYAQILIDGPAEYIAYYDRAQQDLILLEGAAGTYSKNTIASDGDVGQWPSMFIENGTLGLAYHDVSNQDLVLGWRTGNNAFTFNTIDDGENRGADAALYRVDGQWAVAYFDGSNNDLYLAKTTSPGVYSTVKLDGDNGAVGFHNEAAATGDGQWWIGTYDYTSRSLRFYKHR